MDPTAENPQREMVRPDTKDLYGLRKILRGIPNPNRDVVLGMGVTSIHAEQGMRTKEDEDKRRRELAERAVKEARSKIEKGLKEKPFTYIASGNENTSRYYRVERPTDVTLSVDPQGSVIFETAVNRQLDFVTIADPLYQQIFHSKPEIPRETLQFFGLDKSFP